LVWLLKNQLKLVKRSAFDVENEPAYLLGSLKGFSVTDSTILRLREGIVMHGRSLFERGFTVGSSGNISARVPGGFLITPTNSCLGRLDAAQISLMDENWGYISGNKPSKELPLHRVMYETRPKTGAVVHLHSTFATALSMLPNVDTSNMLPPITPYAVMRVGKLALVPYTRPGSDEVIAHIRALQGKHKAILLGNHGPVVADQSLDDAVYASEELEETAKLVVLTREMRPKFLSGADVADLIKTFKLDP
jgi:3-dehydro-4-phosphotetronate decarboxylase